MSDWFPSLPEPKVDTNLFPNAANSGISGGANLPTNLTSGIKGAIEGTKNALSIVTGVQGIQANAQNAEIRQNTIDQLPVTNQLASAEVTEKQQQNTIRQAQIDNLPVTQQTAIKTAEAKAALDDAQARKALAEATKMELEGKRAADDATRQKTITDAFTQIRSDSVGEGLANLDSHFNDLAKSAYVTDDKGKKDLDPSVMAEMNDLVYHAQQTGKPELIQQAQSIATRFRDTISGVETAGKSDKTQGINVTGANQPAEQTSQVDNPDNALLNQVGVSTGAARPNQPSAQAAPAPAPQQNAPAQAAPQQVAQTSQDGAAPTELPQTNVLAPPKQQSENEASPALKAAQAQEQADDVPVSKRVFDTAVDLTPIQDQRLADSVKRLKKSLPNADEKNLLTAASAQVKNQNNWGDSANTAISKASSGVQSLDDTLARVDAALALNDQLEKDGINTNLGKDATLSRGISRGLASSPIGQTDPRVTQLYSQLDALGGLGGLDEIVKRGLGTQAINTPEESAKYSALSFGSDKNKEQLKQAREVLKAQVDNARATLAIYDVYKKRGHDYTDAVLADERYKANNPAVVTTISPDGQPTVKQNPNREDVFKYLDKAMGWDKYTNRNSQGRYSPDTSVDPGLQPPPQPQKGINGVNPLKQYDPHVMPNVVKPFVDSKTVPSANDIPASQPGGVNGATIARQIKFEAKNFNPKSQSFDKDGNVIAEGLMQITRPTGKQLWAKLELSDAYGEYDPFNPEANIIMGTKYMNELLPLFNNDTRLALAAYNAGPKTVNKAFEIAQRVTGDTSWESVQKYMPQSPENRKQTRDYVAKIMGDGEFSETGGTPTDLQKASVFASLPSEKSRESARTILTPAGFKAFQDNADEKDPESFTGVMASAFNKFFDAIDPASTAKADEITAPNTDISTITAADKAVLASPTPAPTDEGDTTTPPPPIASVSSAEPVDPTDTPAPLATVSPKALENYRSQSLGIQSLALGVNRMLAFGWDDEIAGLARAAINGIPYDQAVEEVRGIQEQVRAEHPYYYNTGIAVGIPASIVTTGAAGKLIGTGAKALGLAKTAKTVESIAAAGESTAAIKPTLLKATLQGASSGAKAGFVAGAGESEGNLNQRIQGGIQGGLVGLLFGGAVGAGVARITERAAKKGLIGAIRKTAAGQTLNTAEAEILKRLRGMTPAELKALEAKFSAETNPAYSLVDALGDQKLDMFVKSLATDPSTVNNLQKVTKARVASRPARVAQLVGRAPGTKEQIADKVGKTLKTTLKRIDRQLESTYAPKYDQAKKLWVNNKGVPVFADHQLALNGPIAQVLKDPDIASHIGKVRAEIPSLAQEPKNSFDVLQATKQSLWRAYRSAAGVTRDRLKTAHDTLMKTLAQNNPDYAAADKAFSQATAAKDRVMSKYVQTLGGLAEDVTGKVKDLDKFETAVLNSDQRQFSEFFSNLSTSGKSTFKDLFRGMIERDSQLESSKIFNSGAKSGDFVNTKFADKLETVFGSKQAGEIIDGIKKEQQITKSGKVVQGASSPTAPLQQQAAMRTKTTLASDIGQVGVALGGVVATQGNPWVVLSALHTVNRSIPRMFGAIRAGKLDKAAGQMAKILYEDPQAGKDFIKKVSDNLSQDIKNLDIWKSVVTQATNAMTGGKGHKQPKRVNLGPITPNNK